MGLGTDHITVTTAANFLPELWALDVIEAAESKLVMANLVARFDEVARDAGESIVLPNVSNFEAKNKAASSEVTLQATAENKITLSLDKHKEVSFFIEDIAATQAKADLRTIYTKKAGYAIAKAIDSDLFALCSGLSKSAGTGGSSTDLDESILQAVNYLDEADAPDDDRFMVISPDAKQAMLAIDKFIMSGYKMQSEPDAPVVTGRFGDIYGMTVYVSSNVPQDGTQTISTHNLVFQRGAFGLAIQLGPRVQANYVPQYLGTLVTVDVIYGVCELRDSYACQILT